MVFRSFMAVVAVLAAACSTQDTDATFEVLAIPPATMGTCLAQSGGESASVRGSRRLVIKSIPPGSSRNIVVFVDRNDVPIGVSDFLHVTNGNLDGMGTFVTAFFQDDASAYGYRVDVASTVPDEMRQAADPARIRALMDRATTDQSRRELNADEQRKARALAESIRKRCAS